MNIIIINHYGGSSTRGMEYRPYYIAKELVKRGYNVSIIASSYTHLRDEISGLDYEQVDGINYYWEKNIKYTGNGFKRILNILLFSIKIFFKAKYYSETLNPDVVIASSPHPFVIFGSKRLSVISGSKLFFEVRDLWPLTLLELSKVSCYNPFIVFMKLTEKYAYRTCDKTISLLPNAHEYMFANGLNKSKFIYLPNGVDVENWDDLSVNDSFVSLLDQEKKRGQFLVGYTGSHGPANSLEHLIDAMNILRSESVSLFLIGRGSEKENLQNKVVNLKLKNVFFISEMEKKHIPNILKHFDALYIGLKKTPLFKFGISPNKIMDYMMAGKPIIQSIDASNDIVSEAGCGYSVKAEDAVAIADAILKLRSASSEELNIMGINAKKYVIQKHSYSKLVDKLVEEINFVANTK